MEQDYDMTFGEWLAYCIDAIRKRCPGETVTVDIAKHCGVMTSTVYAWEQDRFRPIDEHHKMLLMLLPSLAKHPIDPSIQEKPGPKAFIPRREIPGYFARAAEALSL